MIGGGGQEQGCSGGYQGDGLTKGCGFCVGFIIQGRSFLSFYHSDVCIRRSFCARQATSTESASPSLVFAGATDAYSASVGTRELLQCTAGYKSKYVAAWHQPRGQLRS